MIRTKDKKLADDIKVKLMDFSNTIYSLPGISEQSALHTFVAQILESLHRIKYIELILSRDINSERSNPDSDLFDPLKAAILMYRSGDLDEAVWLIFLATHFGKHVKDGWRLAKDIYAGNGILDRWTWRRVSARPDDFDNWLKNKFSVFSNDGISRRFGNHRRYETLRPSPRGTASVFRSYVQWIGNNTGHQLLFDNVEKAAQGNPKIAFDILYNSMNVTSFARLGKFDFLTMLGKLGFAKIEPGSPYLIGSTGPVRGAALLFGRSNNGIRNQKELDILATTLGNNLGISMQAVEDALCNWQKSPNRFIPFRG